MEIYHNPRCRKSRETLDLLKRNGVSPHIIEYLKTPPNSDEIKMLLKKLGIKGEQLVRKNEAVFKSKFKNQSFSDQKWTEILAKNPILIERPIVVNGKKAVLGRPPENILKIL